MTRISLKQYQTIVASYKKCNVGSDYRWIGDWLRKEYNILYSNQIVGHELHHYVICEEKDWAWFLLKWS